MKFSQVLKKTLVQPQYSLTVWAIIITLLMGSFMVYYSRLIALEITTNANLVEAALY